MTTNSLPSYRSRPVTRAIAATVLFLCPTVGLAQAAGETAGKIDALVPTVTLFRYGGGPAARQVGARDMPVGWGDVLRTEASGRARILLNDSSLLSLGANSTLRVVKHDSRSQQTYLELGYGRIRCLVARLTRGESSFEIRTPTAVAGVIGTDFGADASQPDETRFLCMEGTVRVRNSDPNVPGSVECAAGMTTVVRRGQPPTTPEPAEPELLERWRHVNEPGDRKFANALTPVNPESMRRRPDSPEWLPQVSAYPGIQWQGMDVNVRLRLRGEAWGWFEAPGGNDSYAFAHSTLRVGIGQRRERFAWQLELAQPTVWGAPDDAILPPPQGQLGLGATYFASNDNQRTAAGIFPSQALVRFHGLGGDPGNQLTLGRFQFIDGLENASADPALAWLKQARIAHRLLGDFDFTAAARSNDGALLGWNLGSTRLTLAAGRPTYGVFRMNGLGSLDVLWAYAALTLPRPAERREVRLFALGYGDARGVVKTDNRPLPARAAERFENVTLSTFGGHFLQVIPAGTAGTFDLLFWGAAQAGSWGVQDHRATAFAAELGWQPTVPSLRPWLRLGFYRSSGDDDPTDQTHNTFFQVLPTPRLYARYPFYNGMNSSDASLMLILRPSPRMTLRSDARALWLTEREDLWYAGGGAYNRTAFGYLGRPGGGHRGLANVWDLSAEYRFSPRFTLGGYYAHAWGKGVVKNVYPDSRGSDYGFLEFTVQY